MSNKQDIPNSAAIPPKPEKPGPNECCGSGCSPCVFDYYYTALEQWQEKYQASMIGIIDNENP